MVGRWKWLATISDPVSESRSSSPTFKVRTLRDGVGIIGLRLVNIVETRRFFSLVSRHGNSSDVWILLLLMEWRRNWDQICGEWRLWWRRLTIVSVKLAVWIVCNLIGDSDTLGVEEAVAGGAGQGGEPGHSWTVDGAEDRRGHAWSDNLFSGGLTGEWIILLQNVTKNENTCLNLICKKFGGF